MVHLLVKRILNAIEMHGTTIKIIAPNERYGEVIP